jgi:hypothetical protein
MLRAGITLFFLLTAIVAIFKRLKAFDTKKRAEDNTANIGRSLFVQQLAATLR